MIIKGKAVTKFMAALRRGSGIDFRKRPPRFRFDCTHVRGGSIIDVFSAENLVTKEGGVHLANSYFKGSGFTSAHYLGLISSASYASTPDVDDVAANLSGTGNGWAECSASYAPNYSTPSSTNRGTLTGGWGTPSSADPVVLAQSATIDFTFSEGGTVKGAFIAGGATRLSTTGPLYSAALFSGDKTVSTSDQLLVSVSVSFDVG